MRAGLVLPLMISFSLLAVKRVILCQNRVHLSLNAPGGMRYMSNL